MLPGSSSSWIWWRYKGEQTPWTLEHIHAQKARGLDSRAEWAQWLHEQRGLLQSLPVGGPLLEELAQWERSGLAFAAKEEARRELALRIIAFFGEAEPGEELHELSNLALLDGSTNTVLGNRPFPEKRQLILQRIGEGKFIPQETRNVFLKYYSTELGEMTRWTAHDRTQYLQAIIDRLQPYLPVREEPA